MTTMKNLSFVLLVLLFISCNKSTIPSNSSIKSIYPDNVFLNARLIRAFDSSYCCLESANSIDTLRTFEIKLTLLNKNKKSISFWTDKYNWWLGFLINWPSLSFQCGYDLGTEPRKTILKSNDSLSLGIFATTKMDHEPYVKESKFGFIYVDTIRCKVAKDYLRYISDQSLREKVIWSNPLPIYKQFHTGGKVILIYNKK